jgi:group I intron endonuclease
MHITPNKKKYIGITCQETKKRWAYGYGYKTNNYFFKAIQKYGWNNIEHIIVAENLNKEDACEMEKNLIKKYRSNNAKYGFNFSTGGEAPYGVEFTEERKKKISNAKKGHIVSDETKEKIRIANTGINNHNYGKHLSKEVRNKISESNKGKKLTEEHKSKLYQLWKKGHTPWNKGKITSQETIEKIKVAKKQKDILCVETNIKYDSLRDAFKNTNINFHHIAEVCKGQRKTAGGYHWKYVEEV